jgi:hypothetical protein
MNPPTFKYRGFGLKIVSDIEFPELFPDDFDLEDVKIESGPIDDLWFENLAARRVHQRVEPDMFKLQIPDAGRYLVKNGNLIQMEPRGASDPTAFRMYGLTVAFSACLLQRNLMLLHASGIIRAEAVFLFAGASGAGKSTLLARLVQRGHQIFSDDVCILDGRKNEQGRSLAAASYPLLKLDQKGLDRYFPASPRKKLWPDAEKFGVSFREGFNPDALPVKGVVLIEIAPMIEEIEVQQLTGLHAFKALSACTYRPGLMSTLDQQKSHARVISGLIDQAGVFVVRRPARSDDGLELVSVIEEVMSRIK